MNVQLKDWFNGSAASVQRGPLVFALKIEEKRVESQRDPEAIRRVLKGNNIQGFPAVEFYPLSEWRYGIDEVQNNAPARFKVIESRMQENPFRADSVPVRIELPLRELPRWEAAWTPAPDPLASEPNMAQQNPANLPTEAEFGAGGALQTMTLVPFGSTHLRLTTLPVVKAKRLQSK